MIVASEQIREINISRYARAFRFLRFSDYLVLYVGIMLILFCIHILVKNIESNVSIIFNAFEISILFFGMYTAWRNFGVMDARLWRLHMFALLLIVFYVLLIFIIGYLNYGKIVFYFNFSLYLLLLGGILGFLSVCRLRRMRIKSFGVRLVEILLYLTSQRSLRALDATKIKRVNAFYGIILQVFGGGILLVLVIVLILKPEIIMDDNNIINYRPFVLASCFLWLRAKRYLQVSADSLLAIDKRNPILFLRSFADDPKGTKGMSSKSDRAWLDFSLEMRLSNHFIWFGPFVAIGSPKEPLPQLGAARVLLPDDEWQSRVLDWMSKASLIIMFAGESHWVNWELARVIETDCVQKLILMLPENKAWNSEEIIRIDHVRELFKNTKWGSSLEGIHDQRKVRAMLFHADGSMTVIKSRPRNRDSYHLAALISHYIILNGFKDIESKVVEKIPLVTKVVKEMAPSSEAKLAKDSLCKKPDKKETDIDSVPNLFCPSCGGQLFTKIYYKECPYCKEFLNKCPKCGTNNMHRKYLENGRWIDWCHNCKK
jgi:hypothetical protein